MINAYDFDGAIYDGDSSVDFYLFCLKKNKKVLLQLPIQIWGTILYILKIIDKTSFKEKIFSFLKQIDDVDLYVKEFWKEKSSNIYSWYLEQKDKSDVIISASPEFLLKPLEKKLKVSVIASRVNKKTGKFEGKNCHDYEKINRFEEKYKNKKVKKFYSDSIKADRAMLEYSKEAFLVENGKVKKIDIKNYKEIHDNILIKLFLFIFFIIFLYIFIDIMFNNSNIIPKCNGMQSLICLFCYSAFTFLIYKLLTKIKINKIIKILFLILFITVQLLFAYIFVINPTWDFGAVFNSALSHINNEIKVYENDYFYRYSNNLGLVLIFIAYYKFLTLFHIYNFLRFSIILNIIMIDLSVFFLRKIMKQLFENKVLDIFTLLTLLFTPFITYVPIFYTDTMSIPFAIGGLYFFMKTWDAKNNKIKIIYSILSGILIGIGSVIKFTVIIIFIAIMIFQIINFKRVKIKNIIISLVFLIIPIIVFNSLLIYYQKSRFDTDKMNKENFPYTHWLMMGSHGVGSYDHTDVEYTSTFNSLSKKKKANIKTFKQRINTMYKENKLIEFYTKKITYVWGDGTLFAPEKLTREPKKDLGIKSYIIGEKQFLFLKISQAEWLFCLLSILLGIIFRKNLNQKQKDIQLICLITMFGLFLFFILWEARSRYIVNMAPIILLSGYIGIESVIKKLKKTK